MGQTPPSSSRPLPGHLSESYLPLMRWKQVATRWGEPGPPETDGPRQASNAESQGDISPRGGGRGCAAAHSPVSSHMEGSLLCLRGWHGGGVEVAVKEGLWVAQNLSHWGTRGASTRPASEVGSGHLPQQGRKEGEGLRQLPKAAVTRCPRPRPWGAQVLQSRGAKMRPGTQHLLPKVTSPTWLRCPELGQKSVLEHELASLEAMCSLPRAPSARVGQPAPQQHLRAGGDRGVLLPGHVQSGRDVNVPESRGLSWSVSAHSVSPIPSCPGNHPCPWGRHHRSTYMSFNGFPCTAQLQGPQQAGETGQYRFYWGQEHPRPASRTGSVRWRHQRWRKRPPRWRP